jgi:predicted nucleic acid-binding protein
MRKRVYIETSIPSFYCETREEPDMVARREWTRAWWDTRLSYEPVTSDAVRYELERGDFPGKEDALAMIADLLCLELAEEIEEIIEAYTAHKLMPVDPLGDALHLALASFHRCDYLLTWNCRNLANPNKFGHIRIMNGMLGLFVPELVTPYQLLEEFR